MVSRLIAWLWSVVVGMEPPLYCVFSVNNSGLLEAKVHNYIQVFNGEPCHLDFAKTCNSCSNAPNGSENKSLNAKILHRAIVCYQFDIQVDYGEAYIWPPESSTGLRMLGLREGQAPHAKTVTIRDIRGGEQSWTEPSEKSAIIHSLVVGTWTTTGIVVFCIHKSAFSRRECGGKFRFNRVIC